MKLNWKFLGGGGVQNKNLLWEEYGHFLELHITQMGYLLDHGSFAFVRPEGYMP